MKKEAKMGKDLAKMRGEMDRTVNSLPLCDESIVAAKQEKTSLYALTFQLAQAGYIQIRGW